MLVQRLEASNWLGFAQHQSCDMLTAGVIQDAFPRFGDVR
jgi:hypothetical protein